jgi:hypothetical protein
LGLCANAASESARAGSADEASGSREQEGRHENGEAGNATGSGRTEAGGDGLPRPAVASRPPGMVVKRSGRFCETVSEDHGVAVFCGFGGSWEAVVNLCREDGCRG